MKKAIALLVATLMIFTLVTGCGNSASDSHTKDTVTILGHLANTTLNPLSAALMEDWVIDALYDTLVRFGPDGSIQPMLAESWTVESDGVTIVFNLRRGVKFHNGLELTADDVIFSFDTLFNTPNYYYLQMYMSSWEKVDDYTVKVVKAAAYCETVNVLAVSLPIVCKAAYEEKGPDEFARDPVGSGPYTFVSQGNDNTVTLKAFPNYWNGKPAIENLIVKAPIDMSTAVVALQNGEIDLITDIPAAQWSTVQSDNSLVFDSTSGWSAMTLSFMNAVKDDVNLRKAIYHGINRQNAITFGTEGTAVECKDIYSALAMKELSGAFDVPGYDVELAKQYLAKSNYMAGTPIKLTVDSPDTVAVGQSIQNDMGQIGITIDLVQVDSNAFNEMLQNGELDLFLSSMGLAPVTVIDMLLCWASDNPFWGPQMAHDDEYDEICSRFNAETDRDRLMLMARRAMEIQYDLANHLGIYEILFSVAHTKDITGFMTLSAAALAYYPGDLKPAN